VNDKLKYIRLWGRDLLNVIIPDLCTVCHTTLVGDEDILCLKCLMNLPRTNAHKTQPNIIHDRLISLTEPVERASSLFWYYRENEYASLIHDAKYNNRPKVARKLAQLHAQELIGYSFFDGIDIILPVPMHILKRVVRGYNQSEVIAKGIADVTGLPIGNNLVTLKLHASQTRKGALQRQENAREIYGVNNPETLNGKHILLVDDVITTGATIVSCMRAIHKLSPTTRFSVFSLALTHLR